LKKFTKVKWLKLNTLVREFAQIVTEKEERMPKLAQLAKDARWYKNLLCLDQVCTHSRLGHVLIAEEKELKWMKKIDAKNVRDNELWT